MVSVIERGCGIAMAILAFSVTASASAASFLSSAKERLLFASVAEQTFVTEAGTMECTKASITAGESPSASIEAAELNVTIKYEQCLVFGFAEVEWSPAEYRFFSNGEVHLEKLMSVAWIGCETDFPAQSVRKVDYTTKGSDLVLEPLVSGLLYSMFGALCAKGGHFANGTYKGHLEMMIPSGTVSFMP
jgi:hypothetical protein